MALLPCLAACDGSMVMGTGMPPGEEPPAPCSSEHPDGVCPRDFRCRDGACQEIPECARDPYEPNDSLARATTLEPGVALEGFACQDDADWFRVVVPAGHVVSVLMNIPGWSDDPSNLDLYAYAADGRALGGRFADKDPNPKSIRGFDTDEEAAGFIATAGAPRTYYVKVVPGALIGSSSYRIVAEATPYLDGGPDCRDLGYTALECTGGRKGTQTLLMFPFHEVADPEAGAGYAFDSVTNYRWVRRETLMLVRYALREVAAKFPGTRPLGMTDMCQRDGITPGYDIGAPRHPATSHDQGGNLDVAYFQTGPDNHTRVICDGQGGSQTPDSWYCLPSAAMTHTVDLPRTVYMVVALARSPRLRAVGVDRVIAPIMQQEAERMLQEGVITDEEYNGYAMHVVWGDAWPAHHHHLHLSLQWL